MQPVAIVFSLERSESVVPVYSMMVSNHPILPRSQHIHDNALYRGALSYQTAFIRSNEQQGRQHNLRQKPCVPCKCCSNEAGIAGGCLLVNPALKSSLFFNICKSENGLALR